MAVDPVQNIYELLNGAEVLGGRVYPVIQPDDARETPAAVYARTDAEAVRALAGTRPICSFAVEVRGQTYTEAVDAQRAVAMHMRSSRGLGVIDVGEPSDGYDIDLKIYRAIFTVVIRG